ncbi:MAG TPA: oligopeptide/dipeptide ABC transporter ATP-binding protein, partial [Reyranella sp.]|nr:oligopeptide/dipeptide ABC transporter ATP-binding protein [Reyranella sp.]
EGQPPDLSSLPPGCSFAPRCPAEFGRCRAEAPPEFALGEGRTARCWLAAPGADAARADIGAAANGPTMRSNVA